MRSSLIGILASFVIFVMTSAMVILLLQLTLRAENKYGKTETAAEKALENYYRDEKEYDGEKKDGEFVFDFYYPDGTPACEEIVEFNIGGKDEFYQYYIGGAGLEQ